MKNLSKFLLLTILLFYSIKLLAQETVNKGGMIIHIRTTSSMGSGSDFINIYKEGTKAKIIYAKFDSIAYAKVKKDTSYINIHIDLNRLEPQKFSQLRPIFDRHSVYDTTRVVVNLKTDTAYYKILQLVTQGSKQELETSKIGERIILDGFSFSGEIITNSDIKNIGIHTPTAKSHPIVAALLEESYNRLWKTRRK